MSEREVLDKGFVRLVDVMGGDDRIVQAARVSYGEGTKTKRQDEALIDYLMRHRHTSPFEKVVFEFHVKAPIFVARQWMRHRTGAFNEVSARYSEMPEEFYTPDEFKAQSKTNKQVSGDVLFSDEQEYAKELYQSVLVYAYEQYKKLLDSGVSREQARGVLPVALYTEFYWTVNLHNLLHFLELRIDPHAQWEIQEYGRAILSLIEPFVPVTLASWQRHRVGAITFSADEQEVIRDGLKHFQVNTEDLAGDRATTMLSKSRARELSEKLNRLLMPEQEE